MRLELKYISKNIRPVRPRQTLCHDEEKRALGKRDNDRGEDTEAPQKQSQQHPKLKA